MDSNSYQSILNTTVTDQFTGIYAPLVHTHTSSQITDFNSSVNTLFDAAFVLKNTDDLKEGVVNLYYTDSRFDTRFATKTTSDLSEGTNLYYTTARANADFDTRFLTYDTDDLVEGISNLYYTTARHNSDFDTRFALQSIGTLSDVDLTSIVTDDLLIYSVSGFVRKPLTDFSLSGHTHTASNITDFNSVVNTLIDAAFLAKSTDNLSEGSTNLYYTTARFDARFAIKTTSDLSEGTNLYYTTARHNTDFDTRFVLQSIGSLANVDLTSLVLNDLLIYNGSNFVRKALSDFSLAGHTHTASDITDFDTEVSNNSSVTANTAKVSADGSINTHSDVVITTPSAGQVLEYNGTNWVNTAISAGAGGSNTQVQYNNSGSLGGISQMTYDGSNVNFTSTIQYDGYDLAKIAGTGGTIHLGNNSGTGSTGLANTAVGSDCLVSTTSSSITAVGSGSCNSGTFEGSTVSVGYYAHRFGADLYSVAIGREAGRTGGSGQASVSIGAFANQSNTADNCICINATGSALNNSVASSCLIKPIRGFNGIGPTNEHYLKWNSSTGEVYYDTYTMYKPTGFRNVNPTDTSAIIHYDSSTSEIVYGAITGLIKSTDLKTTQSEVSAVGYTFMTLPGGEYGFWPQTKTSDGSSAYQMALWCVDAGIWYPGITSYASRVLVRTISGSYRIYCRQRYVTASGTDYWVFALMGTDNRIKSLWNAPDHPSYGSSEGDYKTCVSPFQPMEGEYVVLIHNNSIEEVKANEPITKSQTLNYFICEYYAVDFSAEYKYEPRHSGKWIEENKDGTEVHVKHMVDWIPDDIKVRKLKKLTDVERAAIRAEYAAQAAQSGLPI